MAAKRVEAHAPLGVLVAASFGLDLVWPFLLIAGVERVEVEPGATAFTPLDFVEYPWTHSLLAVMVWGLVAAAVAYRGGLARRAAGLVGTVVVSHWVLDFVTHRPDLPVWPGGPSVGLGLWNSVVGTLVVEGALLLLGVALYVRAAPARDRTGTVGLVALVAFVTVIWAVGPFASPPPSAAAVAYVALALWLLPLWAWRVDSHRG